MDLLLYVVLVCVIAGACVLLITRFPGMPADFAQYGKLVIIVVAAIVILRAVLTSFPLGARFF